MLRMLLKKRASRSRHQVRTEVNTRSSSQGEELDDLNEWRNGQYGWVTKGGKPGPYLEYIRELAKFSEHHYLLADFMDIGTIRSRWYPDEPGGYPEDIVIRDRLKAERMRRTRVCLLEYPREDTKIRSRTIRDPEDLKSVLSSLQVDTSLKLRLFVVEDLSREVIEALGHHLKIDPSVFLDHIVDSEWEDLDDAHLTPPRLRTSVLKQNWYTVRYVRARYFITSRIFREATDSSENFNIPRRLKSVDEYSFGYQGEENVGLIQSKATLWIQRPSEARNTDSNTSNAHGPSVAVVLLDPPIKEGNPLWLGSRNWTQIPSVGEPPSRDDKVPEDSHFEQFIYLAMRPELFTCPRKDNSLSSTWIPTQILMHIICNQWLTLLDYLETKLKHTEWEITFPDDFEISHTEMAGMPIGFVRWHRMLPAFHKMIQDMDTLYDMALGPLNNQEICHMQSDYSLDIKSKGDSHECHCRMHERRNPYQLDIMRLHDRMGKYIDRIEKWGKANSVHGSVKHSLIRRDISRKIFWIIWLTIVWILGPVLANILTVTTDSTSSLLPSLGLWGAGAMPLMLILLLGLRFYAA